MSVGDFMAAVLPFAILATFLFLTGRGVIKFANLTFSHNRLLNISNLRNIVSFVLYTIFFLIIVLFMFYCARGGRSGHYESSNSQDIINDSNKRRVEKEIGFDAEEAVKESLYGSANKNMPAKTENDYDSDSAYQAELRRVERETGVALSKRSSQ